MRKRLVFRCDDIGYTEAYDLGIFKVLDAGIGSSADVMFDAPHAREALAKLKEYPWLSIGWHRHLWESPVLPPEEVPTLVDEEGRFKWRHKRPDLMKEASYEDAYKEFMAEAELCRSILGRYPDTAGMRKKDIPLEQAFMDVLDSLHVACGYLSTEPGSRFMSSALPEYEHLNVISVNIMPEGGFHLNHFDQYDPLAKMMKPVWTEKEEIFLYGWHPGFVDAHIMKESSCNLHRCKEYEAAMSEIYRNWIISNKIELISQRDLLHGTNEFQDHLKETGSPLWIGNM